jgi:hypothetical protein
MNQNVRVRHGVYELDLALAGQSVGALRRSLGPALNLAPAALALVNGQPVSESYTVEPGDSVEFVRQAGQKGSARATGAQTEQPCP